jgi:hypothetical protein
MARPSPPLLFRTAALVTGPDVRPAAEILQAPFRVRRRNSNDSIKFL